MIPILSLLNGIVKVVLFLCNLWKERDEDLAKMKAEVAKEIVNAFTETDKKTQASRLNSAVSSINRLRT